MRPLTTLDDILISLDSREPLAGTARTGSRGPLRFEGWLELLRVLADLVGADPLGGTVGRDVPHDEG